MRCPCCLSITCLRRRGLRACGSSSASVARAVPGEPLEWLVEPKVDGVAISLRYEAWGARRAGQPEETAKRAMTSRKI